MAAIDQEVRSKALSRVYAEVGITAYLGYLSPNQFEKKSDFLMKVA